jgi:hypothetical protein
MPATPPPATITVFSGLGCKSLTVSFALCVLHLSSMKSRAIVAAEIGLVNLL